VSRLQASAPAVAAVVAVWPTTTTKKNCTNFNRDNFTFFYLCDAVSAVLSTATCLAGWLAYGWLAAWVAVRHTRRYCIKTAKHVWKSFTTFWKNHHSSFSRPLSRYTIPRETPSAGALNTKGWEKLAIFVLFSTDIAVYLGNGVR